MGGLYGAVIGIFQLIVVFFEDRIFHYELLTKSMKVKKPVSLSDEDSYLNLKNPSQE